MGGAYSINNNICACVMLIKLYLYMYIYNPCLEQFISMQLILFKLLAKIA